MTDERRDGAAPEAKREGFTGWLDAVRATRTGRLTFRVVVGVLGATLVIGGLVLVPLPGPGWLIVFAGLAVLATEFAWAHRLLEFAKRTLSAWTDWLLRQNWAVRILVAGVTFAFATVLVWFMLKLSLGVDLLQMAQTFLARTRA
ncbi:TIGR02611 family protein [Sphaerisporangium sp. B11E5]|uniref:TIGR02611 family protein n=1 Tax=Sphaerisporangium sp. B11E5 TaxID=3153563 RepID=UPI00325F13BA